MPNQNLKGDILEATIQAFQKKGLKFTMDDIASLLGISKKTIYTVFPDKNSLVLEMVDYCFSSIKESEEKVLQDLSLDTVGKIRAILGVLPEGYRELDLRQLYQLEVSRSLWKSKIPSGNRVGEYDFITGTGHHRRKNSKYPDSNFKNHDGSHIRTVFSERRAGPEWNFLSWGIRWSRIHSDRWHYNLTRGNLLWEKYRN